MSWSKSIGIQVNVDSRTVYTVTDHKEEEAKVEKSIAEICEKLKTELSTLHLNIERQSAVFPEDAFDASSSGTKKY
ncbi:hypothetical protein HHI36_010466 [Cryptolaemus montrouzieri]|uniref:Uncharacterized protein n=1 Tax=Cryptolaemus montrouzieri TaxID=559131 RepID=A0ABD2MIS6_9CUCU